MGELQNVKASDASKIIARLGIPGRIGLSGVLFTGAADDPTIGSLYIPDQYMQAATNNSTAFVDSMFLKDYAVKSRYQRQTGGITVSGVAVSSDDYSRVMISDACSYLALAPDVGSVNFKGVGGWATIPRAQMLAIGLSLGAYVQACFDAEMAIDAAITSGGITTIEEIDQYGWPSPER